jgi:hypothetical protein
MSQIIYVNPVILSDLPELLFPGLVFRLPVSPAKRVVKSQILSGGTDMRVDEWQEKRA